LFAEVDRNPSMFSKGMLGSPIINAVMKLFSSFWLKAFCSFGLKTSKA
jgi:hypothetical protein